tara:strand:- start:209 stop:2035 length:1827 start_codon:yes stop_codon:yes gene_type:complete
MKRLKPKRMAKKNRVYYWDIESWGLNPQNPAFIVVKPERQYTRDMPEEWIFQNGSHMRSWLATLPKTKNHIFYAHNSHRFDTLCLYNAIEIAESEKCMAGNTIYTLQPEKNLEFRDSMHLLNAPLAAYGAKGITPQKFIDENHPDYGDLESITEADIEYCRLDVDILRDAILTLREAYRDWTGKEDADLPLTSASLAYRVWCARYWPEHWSYLGKTGTRYYSVTFPHKANDAARRGYYGGRVQVFDNFAGVEVFDVMSGDRNSMFPAEMVAKIFPDPNKVFEANPTVQRVGRARKKGVPYWGHVVLEAGPDAELFLPKIIDKKASYDETFYDGYLMYPEINYALDNGWKLLDVKELFVAQPCNYFEGHVSYFYDLRSRLKLAGDDARQQFIKVGPLNSLYGKFGQRDRCDRIEDPASITKITQEDGWRDRYQVNFWNTESPRFYLVENEPSSESKNTFFPWAAAVTSYARVELQRSISRCRKAGYEVVYCDTDSIHIHNIDSLENIPLEIGRDLGQWGWEYPKDKDGKVVCEIVPKAIYWERKAYVWFAPNGAKIKIKHKGVSDSDGDLTKVQTNRSVVQYRTAMRRQLESGYELKTDKKSKRYYNGG